MTQEQVEEYIWKAIISAVCSTIISGLFYLILVAFWL